jgi:hypothetical protein
MSGFLPRRLPLCALGYLVLTLIGLFVFRGIPLLNVALGFPIGAAVALRRLKQPQRPDDMPQAPPATPAPPDAALSTAAAAGSTPAPSPLGDEAAAPRSPLRIALREAMAWAILTAAFSMTLCWTELAASVIVTRYGGPYAVHTWWVPLFPPPASAELVRAQLFAVVTAPLLQVMTTAFGGVLAVLDRR